MRLLELRQPEQLSPDGRWPIRTEHLADLSAVEGIEQRK
jgi:hypothetical protein